MGNTDMKIEDKKYCTGVASNGSVNITPTFEDESQSLTSRYDSRGKKIFRKKSS